MERQLFDGIKIVDFTWAGVGPRTIKYLAEYGAELIKIESAKRPDILRTLPPFADNRPGLDRSAAFTRANNNKYSMALNLNHPKGVELAKRLVARADIVAESFTPGTMKKWGLDYGNLRRINPSIIMVSTCMQGQTGPDSKHPGYGIPLTSLSGINGITGWSDRPASGTYGPYTDFVAPLFNALALLSALDYRERTGYGQYLDLSQYECSIHFLAPLILDYAVNKREFTRQGNYSPHAAPHGVYRCKGEDRWCAISVSTDEEWRNFCKVIGNPRWTSDQKFGTLSNRKENEAELDRMVQGWTIDRSPEEVMALMQKSGVAAGVVATGEDLWNDPQLRHYNSMCEFDHPEMGSCFCQRVSVELSRASYELRRPPLCGEHTEYVCKQILGMSDKEFVGLLVAGVFE